MSYITVNSNNELDLEEILGCLLGIFLKEKYNFSVHYYEEQIPYYYYDIYLKKSDFRLQSEVDIVELVTPLTYATISKYSNEEHIKGMYTLFSIEMQNNGCDYKESMLRFILKSIITLNPNLIYFFSETHILYNSEELFNLINSDIVLGNL